MSPYALLRCSKMRRKRTSASSLLRRLMTKFTVVAQGKTAAAWGPAFTGEQERALTREEQRLRESASQTRLVSDIGCPCEVMASVNGWARSALLQSCPRRMILARPAVSDLLTSGALVERLARVSLSVTAHVWCVAGIK